MTRPSIDLDKVADLIREATAQEIMPRWRNLQPHEVRDKGGDDPVTAADEGAERFLSEHLPGLIPGSVVVGEEGVAEDASLLDRLHGDKPVWIVDPVDGTTNFKNGSDVFCCMVALVQGGESLAGWIFSPVSNEFAMAEKGAGATVNGERLEPSTVKLHERMRTAIHLQYMPKEAASTLEPQIGKFHGNRQIYCAGHTYLQLANGKLDLATFWRTKPWDHAMGSLIVAEAGGHTAYTDGTPYRADILGRMCLLSVSHKPNFGGVCDVLFPDGPITE